MKITAHTRFKHGALFSGLRALGWTGKILAEKTDIDARSISRYLNLRGRPSEENALKIEKCFIENGIAFNASEEWPEAFKGFKNGIIINQTEDISNDKLSAIQQFYLNCEPDSNERLTIGEGALRKIFEILKPKQRLVLEKHYGLMGNEPMKLSEIANELGMSFSAISALERSALSSLRHPFTFPKIAEHIESK